MGQLLLTRKTGERIMVGDSVVITVVKMKDGHVTIGIDAPKNIPVHREEVWESIRRGEVR